MLEDGKSSFQTPRSSIDSVDEMRIHRSYKSGGGERLSRAPSPE